MIVTFGELIQQKRKALGMTQEQLAAILSCDRSVISKYEHNLAMPPNGHQSKTLRLLLGMSRDEFYQVMEDGSQQQEDKKNEKQEFQDYVIKHYNLSPDDPGYIRKVTNIMLDLVDTKSKRKQQEE